MLCLVPVELHSTTSRISSMELPCDLAVYGYTLGSTTMIYIHLTFYSRKITHLYTYLYLLLKLTWNTHKSVKYVPYLLYSVFFNSVSVMAASNAAWLGWNGTSVGTNHWRLE